MLSTYANETGDDKRHAAREGRSGEGDGFQIRTPRSDPNLADFRPRTAAPPARDNKQKLISQTKDGARSRRLDRTTQPVQTTLRNRRENSLRQGSCSSTRSMKTTASYSLLFLYISPFSVLYFQAREILMEESNVQPVRCPVTVCGDIHGQFVRSILAPPQILDSSSFELPLHHPRPLHVSLHPIVTFHSTIYQSSSASAATHPIPTTSSWVIT